jgi:hypothetical protein
MAAGLFKRSVFVADKLFSAQTICVELPLVVFWDKRIPY